MLVQCALTTAIRYDAHLRIFYDRIRNRRGHATALVATIAKRITCYYMDMLTRNQLYRYMNKQRYEPKLTEIRTSIDKKRKASIYYCCLYIFLALAYVQKILLE